MLSCEHMFTSSHVILVAHPSATSEGTLYPSYSGFFRLREHRPRFPASPQIHRQLLNGYFQAGEMTPLMNLLSEDVILWADGGGKVKQAALRPIRGRDAVARFSLGTKRTLVSSQEKSTVKPL